VQRSENTRKNSFLNYKSAALNQLSFQTAQLGSFLYALPLEGARICSPSRSSSAQLFIRVHNETLSVVAMCVCNPDRSPARIHG
jgi:hypothetical protein